MKYIEVFKHIELPLHITVFLFPSCEMEIKVDEVQ